MSSRERLLAALDHREPDRIPLDLGSTQVTGIHAVAYGRLRQALELPRVPRGADGDGPQLCDAIQRLALPDDDAVQRLGVDVRGLYPRNSHNWNVREEEGDGYWVYRDEWGITHRRPRPEGLYYSVWQVPLPGPELTVAAIRNHRWPNMADAQRIAGLRELAERYRSRGYGVVLKSPFAGLFETAQRIVGMEQCLMLLVSDEKLAGVLFDKLLELKLAFWEMALPVLAPVVDVVAEFDDYGTQTSLLLSPRTFRRLFKPRLTILLRCLGELAPGARRVFHSSGAIRPLIPDLIEAGVEILNPLHLRAAGMEPGALRRDFGDALTFWGGGVDTQGVLPHGTPQEVKDEVRRNVDALAPGGGYVFSAVHNIQADVPAENMIAMWEAVREYGAC